MPRPSVELTPEERALLDAFCADRLSSPKTWKRYATLLRTFRAVTGSSLLGASADDVRRWYEAVVKKRKVSTVLSNAIKLRALYAFWLKTQGLSEHEAELKAREIFSPVPFRHLSDKERKELRLRDKIITPEELDKLLRATEHPRLKALIAVAYETGARPHELLSLRLRDVVFRDRYALLKVSGKTGERAVPIIHSLPYLTAWLNVHPAREDPEAPLFCVVWRGRIKPITSDAFSKALRELSKRAGLSRRIHPYMFRHTRLTELAAKGLGEYQMKQLAGWTPGSRMADRYIRLGQHAGIRAVLVLEGVEEPGEVERPRPVLRTARCPRCGYENMSDALYCARCGFSLREEAALEAMSADELLAKLLARPDVRETLIRAIQEMVERGEIRLRKGSERVFGAEGGKRKNVRSRE